MTAKWTIAAAGIVTSAVAVHAQASDGVYRGRIVCEKIEIARDILNVPFDLIVHGQTVQFARPVFDLRGRIFGSELGTGTVDTNGKLHAAASRIFLGQTVESEYSGTLTTSSGTLTGKQSWHGSNGEGSRNCHIALMPAPTALQAAREQK